MKRPLTYLACPYSHPIPEVREWRAKQATFATAELIRERGWNVFSPITHSHPLHITAGLDGSWQFWERIDTEYISLSARMVVLMLPGWRDSVGIKSEIAIAKKKRVPVFYMPWSVIVEKLKVSPGQDD
jgi:hypothetical protein